MAIIIVRAQFSHSGCERFFENNKQTDIVLASIFFNQEKFLDTFVKDKNHCTVSRELCKITKIENIHVGNIELKITKYLTL